MGDQPNDTWSELLADLIQAARGAAQSVNALKEVVERDRTDARQAIKAAEERLDRSIRDIETRLERHIRDSESRTSKAVEEKSVVAARAAATSALEELSGIKAELKDLHDDKVALEQARDKINDRINSLGQELRAADAKQSEKLVAFGQRAGLATLFVTALVAIAAYWLKG